MESFIAEHTMLPYYIRFLPLERRRKAMDLLLAMDRTFYDAIYVRQKKSERRQYMRYCPMCAAADREQHGETYWHRKHQLPGVEICMEHRCRLENSSNGITVESQRFKLIHAEMVIPQYTPVNLDVSDLEYQLSDYVMQIFDADMDFDSDVSTGKFLQSRLEGTPYTSLRGEQVFARKLYAALSEHYQELPQNTLEAWWYVQKVFCSQNFQRHSPVRLPALPQRPSGIPEPILPQLRRSVPGALLDHIRPAVENLPLLRHQNAATTLREFPAGSDLPAPYRNQPVVMQHFRERMGPAFLCHGAIPEFHPVSLFVRHTVRQF
jgi:hypothetical protein